MRILIVTNYYPPHYFGGYEIKCHQIASRLRDRGHEVFILAGNYVNGDATTGEEPHVSRTLQYDTPDTPFLAHLSLEKNNYHKTSARIRTFQPDVIYLWNQRGITLGPSQAACDSGIAKIHQIGDFWPNTYIKPGRKAALRRLLRNLLPIGVKTKPDLSPAIVVGNWMAEEMKQKFGTRIIHHVPHGCDLPPVPSFDRFDSTVTKFLFAGRIDPEKGLDVAIRAFTLLRERGIVADYEFNILGGGDDSYITACKKLIDDNGLSDRIHFLGKTSQIDRYYSTHEVLLMPTLMREPFGLVIIEAMSHAMIPVVSDAYGPQEIVRHLEDGLRFKPADANELADNIRLLIEDPSLRLKLGKAARASIEDRFRINREVAQIESILSDLAENRQPES